LKEQKVAIEIIVESTGLSYEAIQRIWVNKVVAHFLGSWQKCRLRWWVGL
jgi:hypothetical protein